jgi:hypothetical protein
MTTPFSTFEANSRPSFRERVYALAGHTTWREPTGAGTSHLRAIPADHMVAAALSFGRRNPQDVGPDIAMDIATGLPGHRRPVCAALGKALAGDRSVLVRRNQGYIAHVALAAYWAVLGRPVPDAPDGIAAEDWGDLVAAGALVLERLAEDALALAGRRNRRAA